MRIASTHSRHVRHQTAARLPTVAALTLLGIVSVALSMPRHAPAKEQRLDMKVRTEAPGRFWSNNLDSRIKQ